MNLSRRDIRSKKSCPQLGFYENMILAKREKRNDKRKREVINVTKFVKDARKNGT